MSEKVETWSKFLERLRQRFAIPNAGPLSCFLGMEITYRPEEGVMFISQAHTVDVLLERAGMSDCNPVQLPCQPGAIFTKKDCPTPPSTRSTEYAALIALANFIACWTRPDIPLLASTCLPQIWEYDVGMQMKTHTAIKGPM